MGRRESREKAVLFIFEGLFKEESIEEIIENSEDEGEKIDPFIKDLFNGVHENKEEIDSLIEKHLKNWDKSRVSKLALSILRECIYEMLFRKDIPENVSINESVELAKKYGSEQESSFVNGILGSISKELSSNNE